MPIRLNLLERLVLLRLNQGPGPALDLFGAMAFHVVLAAMQMGIYENLAEEPKGIARLAQELGLDPRGAQVLMDALAATGYVSAHNGTYANTRMTSKWLLRSSPQSFAAFLEWWGEQVLPFWDLYLEEGLRRGEPPISICDWLDERPRGWDLAQAGFEAVARQAAGEIAARLEIPPGSSRLLDVGGGHGLYSIAVCQRNPDLSATVFDLPQVLDRARKNIQMQDLRNRIAVQGGDMHQDDLGQGYDVALLFNIIHAHTAEENVSLFRKIANALNPDGLVAILDQFKGRLPGSVAKAAASLLGVAYLANLGGRIYAEDEVVAWLRSAGFAKTGRITLWKSPGNSLILGRKKGLPGGTSER